MVNFEKGMLKLTFDLKYFWTLDIFFCDILDIDTIIFWTSGQLVKIKIKVIKVKEEND